MYYVGCHQILLSVLFGEGVNWQNVAASVTRKWMGMEQWWNDGTCNFWKIMSCEVVNCSVSGPCPVSVFLRAPLNSQFYWKRNLRKFLHKCLSTN